MMRSLLILIIGVCLLGVYVSPACAGTVASASVSANILTLADVAFSTSGNSKATSPTVITFSKRDDEDTDYIPEDEYDALSPGFMYAPPRSEAGHGETGKNWHEAVVLSNGSSTTLTMAVTLSGGISADHLKVWCGGFWLAGSKFEDGPLPGTETPDDGVPGVDYWETADGWSRTVTRPFIGVVPFNYRLDISDVPAGSYSGNVTLTLTTT